MSESPGDTGDRHDATVGCGCLSSLFVAVVSGFLVWVLEAPADSFLGGSLLLLVVCSTFLTVLFFTLAATKPQPQPTTAQSSGSSFGPGYQDGGDGRPTVPDRPYELRAMPYEEYLRTPYWKRRREEKLQAVGHRCQLCNRGSGTLDVHHRTYERLGEERDVDLTVLCRACHDTFHEHRRLGR